MPANFGEIADYHRQEAAHFFALAQAARDRESYNEAEYLTSLAMRYAEAAQEQKVEMRQEPCPSIARPRPEGWSSPKLPPPPSPPPTPLAAISLPAILHAAGNLATAIRQLLSRRVRTAFSHRL
jgi:hypothetical protein